MNKQASRERAEHHLALQWDAEVERISDWMVGVLRSKLRRRGLVVAISGGIDSSVCARLAVQAVGPDRVLGLLMPERDSSPESLSRGRTLVEHLGIDHVVEDIADTLSAIGCYQWRDDAMRRVFSDYEATWRSKVVIAGGSAGRINHFHLIVQPPGADPREQRLRLPEYLQIVAATNFKQRIRKTLEYAHADRLNYAVVGTPNRLEYDQGFFVKNGDGSADLKPIAHLYKTQVYMLAAHLGLPAEICAAEPTTDTYSLPQGQDEFYYALAYPDMDLALWHYNRGDPPAVLARTLEIVEEDARFIYADIERKRDTTASLHWGGLVIESLLTPRSGSLLAKASQ